MSTGAGVGLLLLGSGGVRVEFDSTMSPGRVVVRACSDSELTGSGRCAFSSEFAFRKASSKSGRVSACPPNDTNMAIDTITTAFMDVAKSIYPTSKQYHTSTRV